MAAMIVAAIAFVGIVPSTGHRGDGMSAPHDNGPIDVQSGETLRYDLHVGEAAIAW